MALNPFEQLQIVVSEPRQAFEDSAASIFRLTIPGSRRVRVHRGDGGVDVYNGTYGPAGGVDVYQIKYFPTIWGDAQKAQLRDAYTTARNNADYELQSWLLCVPVRLTKDDIRWFDGWRASQDTRIELIDGDDLTSLLEHDECAPVRRQLHDWGVMRMQTSGPRFAGRAYVRREDVAKTGLLGVVILQVENEGDRSAHDIRVIVSHSETGCIAGGHSAEWWMEPKGGMLKSLNPRDLIAIHPLHPGDKIPVLGIPICDRTDFPFSIQVEIRAQDMLSTKLTAVVSCQQMSDGASVPLVSGAEAALATARPPVNGLTQPSSPAAKELLEVILANTNLGELGLTQVLEGDPGSLLNAAFIPSISGRGQVMTIRKRLFDSAIEELVQLGWLLDPEVDDKIAVYELADDVVQKHR